MFSVCAIRYHLVAIQSGNAGVAKLRLSIYIYMSVVLRKKRTREKLHNYQRKTHILAGKNKYDKFLLHNPQQESMLGR